MSAAAARLTVSTNCPNCGAAIDFGEGTNALLCDHCRSRLLVTGHGRVLSYFVAPRVDRSSAISVARFAESQNRGPLREGETRLLFLPYYRLTALDLRWQRPERKPPILEEEPDLDRDPDYRMAKIVAKLAEQELAEEMECQDRAIERNFLAIDLPATGLYSLGMRPNALRLELYRREALAELGHAVAPEMAVDHALETARKTGSSTAVAYRAVIGGVLSLVYYPFWFVEIRRPQALSVTIVDAVAQSIVERGVKPEIVERLGRQPSEDATVVGFRPLVCPNCGWDLPVAPEHVIFYCTSCARAWRISGDELLELAHRIAASPRASADAEHLPFWSLELSIDDDAAKPFLVPAFRYRRARDLVELTRQLAGISPPFAETKGNLHSARGGFFDESDAASLSLLAEAGSGDRAFEAIEHWRGRTARVDRSELVWIPYSGDSYCLRDPYCGMAVTKTLLL